MTRTDILNDKAVFVLMACDAVGRSDDTISRQVVIMCKLGYCALDQKDSILVKR